MIAFPSLAPVLPELLVLGAALVMLMYGVFRGAAGERAVTWLAGIAMAAALVAVIAAPGDSRATFEGLFVSDAFSRFMKALVLIGAILTLIMAQGFRERERMMHFEYPVLITFATLGMLMMVSADDLMALYLGLELQSLPLYVIAAFKRDQERSTEAGLKYFILGALSSGLLLYGCSLIYGFTGTTGFAGIAERLAADGAGIGVIVGMVFLSAGLAFKVSAVPFHMWTPDVYEGAPTPVAAFFAAAPKIAAVALFLRVLVDPFGDMVDQWRQVIVFIAIASMVLGAFAAIYQTNIKRLMAYSSIGNIGYALVGLAAGTEQGVQGVIIYMTIYLAMTAGAFACILAMRHRGQMVEGISDLAGLARTHPPLALAFGILMFSLAGIPPLAGFFGKLYVFLAAVEAGLYTLAVIGLLTSVVGAFYYVRIVKLMYFDEPGEPFDHPIGGELTLVVVVTSLFVLLFFVYPMPVVAGAAGAAAALFP
ncbi:MAG: NADH-quinone oxidoreductase subunit NuoN [Alphaproteobacteria bacterium]|jgi:NADH-quinone oxidoreductase subunit N|nr:NADH-quinone oxidoreductase subunit NuoN [Alphaproteobacteria bacterium]MDP6517727.1 NADH-quinone oxidoreductase subunit NuoN [Alphaproteobacteria bacterium]